MGHLRSNRVGRARSDALLYATSRNRRCEIAVCCCSVTVTLTISPFGSFADARNAVVNASGVAGNASNVDTAQGQPPVRMYSSTFRPRTSNGTLPPSTTVSLNALRS